MTDNSFIYRFFEASEMASGPEGMNRNLAAMQTYAPLAIAEELHRIANALEKLAGCVVADSAEGYPPIFNAGDVGGER